MSDTLFKYIHIDSKAINSEERSLVAVGSKEVIDRDGDLIPIKGINLTEYKKNPVVLRAHNYSDLPVARTDKVWKSGDELKFKIDFPTAEVSAMGDAIWRLYEGGYMHSFSIGFIPDFSAIEYPKEEPNTKSKEKLPNRIFHKIQLLEISVVSVPANQDALVAGCTKALKDNVLTDTECKDILDMYTKSEDEKLWDSYTKQGGIIPLHKSQLDKDIVKAVVDAMDDEDGSPVDANDKDVDNTTEKEMNIDEKDWLYLIHHMHPDPGNITKIEILHHCDMFSKKGENGDMFTQKHVKKGKRTFVHAILTDDVKEVPEVLYDHLDNKFEIKTKTIDGKKHAVIDNLTDKNIGDIDTKKLDIPELTNEQLVETLREMSTKISILDGKLYEQELTKEIETDDDKYWSEMLKGFRVTGGSDEPADGDQTEDGENFDEYIGKILGDE